MSGPSSPGDQDRIRIGNADRERVVQQLNDAFAEGRLDVHELDERVAAAYAAKTFADLRPLTADLPTGTSAAPARHRPAEPQPAMPSGPPAPVAGRRGGLEAMRGLFGIFVINVVIWGIVSLTNGHVIYFWPAWVAVPLVLATVSYVVGGGRSSPRDQARWQRRSRRRW